jgi:hypothetical protein
MLLFSAIFINQIIKQLSSKGVKRLTRLCLKKIRTLVHYLNEFSTIPHLPKERKPSKVYMCSMGLVSGSLFSLFIILVVVGLYFNDFKSIIELVLLAFCWFSLVFLARCFYAEAYRERAKLDD